MRVKTDTIVRTIVLVIALANQVLAIYGKEKFPVTEEEIYQLATLIVTISASVWAWWKNNSFTKAAIEADEIKDSIKRENDSYGV
jgi:SPP1 family holin